MPKRDRTSPVATIAELRAEFWRAPDEALLNRKITAAGLGYTVGWLEWVATNGGGPILTKIGRSVRYRKTDMLVWLDANSRRVERASDVAGERQ